MDVISHGLWGGIAFGRKNKKFFLWSFVIGSAPDVFSFGILLAANILGILERPDWGGHPQTNNIPYFVHALYDVTHSLIIFAFIFILTWLIRWKPFWPLLAWGLHILVDIPTHSSEFFPTPFLWPFSDFRIHGVNWSNPWIFFSDWILLFLVYASWFLYRKFSIKK